MASLWQEGDILEVVNKCKASNGIFVTFVKGNDELSVYLNTLFENEEVLKRLKTDRFVAIKTEENSETHQFFVQIYPQTSVPFICFVALNGFNIVSITEKISVEEFCSKIDDIVAKDIQYVNDKKKVNEAKTNEEVIDGENLNENETLSDENTTEEEEVVSEETTAEEETISKENTIEEKIITEEEVTAEAATGKEIINETSIIKNEFKTVEDTIEKEQATVDKKESDSNEEKITENVPKELSQEEKVQHAKELIEQRNEEKKKQEEEAERQKEIERRKMGQNVQQMKRWQQDEKMKQMMEERNRERREDQAARDRVLAQIAQDKIERAARFSKQESPTTSSISQVSKEATKAIPSKSSTTKLQFRLPEGAIYTHEFLIGDTLDKVHQYIMNELTLPFANYTISTTFPRREFNERDCSQTLLDLQLVPNAVILILPQVQGAASGGGLLSNVFWWVLAPFMSVYDFLVGFLFGTPSIRRNETASKRSVSDNESTTRSQSKKQGGNSTEIKKQGNIHRLKEKPDTDDENNTWNGNSTQQM